MSRSSAVPERLELQSLALCGRGRLGDVSARGQQLAEIAGIGDRDQLLLGLWQRHAGHRRAIDALFLRAQVLTRQPGNWTPALHPPKPPALVCPPPPSP